MDQWLRMLAVIPLHGFLFLCIGTLILYALRISEKTLVSALISGYFGYFLLFEVVCVPAQYMNVHTSALARILAVLWGLIIVSAVLIGRGFWAKRLKMTGEICRRHGPILILLTAAVLIQCVIVAMYVDTSQDAAFYIGTANTAVHTDTLAHYNPYTGKRVHYFVMRYFFSVYPFHNAVMSVLSGLSVIIQAKVVMPVIHVIMANLIWHQMGRSLFGKKADVRYADLYTGCVVGIYLFADTLFLPGQFYFCRIYEGKSLVSNLIIPAVLLAGLRLWDDVHDRISWCGLFCVTASAICFAGTGYISAILTGAVMLPVCVRHRSLKAVLYTFIAMLPVLAWMAFYLLRKYGYVSLTMH